MTGRSAIAQIHAKNGAYGIDLPSASATMLTLAAPAPA